MKLSFKTLFVVAAFGAFTMTSCSGNKAETTAENAGAAIEGAADSVKADMAPEAGDTAVVRNVPADKVVEEVPAKH